MTCKIFISPSTLADSFAPYNSLGGKLRNSRAWDALLSTLPLFKVSIEKSANILTGFLYKWLVFVFSWCTQPSLFCVFSVFTMIYHEKLLLWSYLFGVFCGFFCTWIGVSFHSLTFSSMSLLKIWSIPLIWESFIYIFL